jgi:glycosyltransferase involved in cell wall biosynthesis
LAMQKAVVASNIGWANEIIDEGKNGFLVNPKNHSKYAQKILELLNNPALQKEFGVAARKKIINTFSISIVAQQSLAFYKSLIQ